MLARVINQNVAHHLSRDAEEVGAVLPRDVRPLDEPEIRFVDDGRRLQRVVGALLAQIIFRQLAQLSVHLLKEHVGCRLVTPARLEQ